HGRRPHGPRRAGAPVPGLAAAAHAAGAGLAATAARPRAPARVHRLGGGTEGAAGCWRARLSSVHPWAAPGPLERALAAPARQLPPMPLSLAWRPRPHVSARLRVFIDWMVELMAPLDAGGPG